MIHFRIISTVKAQKSKTIMITISNLLQVQELEEKGHLKEIKVTVIINKKSKPKQEEI